MTTTLEIPQFASEPWYRDFSDHRCPHDAWLESIEIAEPAEGDRHQHRTTSITICLLGAYHDGQIVFRYGGVRRYSLAALECTRGHRDWLSDSFAIADGYIVHEIVWGGASSKEGEESDWRIEARDIGFEWIPCV